ncbi:MAG: component of SufBCD complex [Defluviimonas sp.]|uniref:component of SufBCD complex n=1 Tax=Albidovulum sp. TaxID=1872424 RepID=UPI001DE35EFF|nr:component of SufBCD complex [Paracoccaceae bacterium]MCC0063945.1 component of SufBCD complex [Defluviimonas sp.]
MDLQQVILDLIDFRSFSNLWYWIALAVTWSSASHWVLGVPYDMVLRARRQGGQAEVDLEDMVRINVNRLLYIGRQTGLMLAAFSAFVLTSLALLGFVYAVEFCQAVFLIVLPLSAVGLLSLRTAGRIERSGEVGEALQRRLTRHRLGVQILGMIAIFITALWGMLQNFNLSVLPG